MYLVVLAGGLLNGCYWYHQPSWYRDNRKTERKHKIQHQHYTGIVQGTRYKVQGTGYKEQDIIQLKYFIFMNCVQKYCSPVFGKGVCWI